MKLATLADGSRDGQLVVVSRDLAQAHLASAIASRLQQVLDDWNFISPQLEDLSATLNGGKARHAFAFDPRLCRAPLPRAYAAVIDARRVGSDALLGPGDDVRWAADDGAVVCRPSVAVVTGDMGAAALDAVRLLVLAADWRLDGVVDVLQANRATAFAPVAATPDEAGSAWRGGRLQLALACSRNGERIEIDAGQPSPGEWLARTRGLRAGAIVGGGIGPGVAMQAGDTLRVEAIGADGQSLFGAIEQRLVEAAE